MTKKEDLSLSASLNLEPIINSQVTRRRLASLLVKFTPFRVNIRLSPNMRVLDNVMF